MVVRWLVLCPIFLGLVSGSRLLAQTAFGTVQVERLEDAPTQAEFGWSRPQGITRPVGAVAPPGASFAARLAMLPAHLFQHSDPNDPARHVGLGHPLAGTSWRNRPFHVGWLFGGMFGDQLYDERISQDEDLFGGYRLGWDFDHYWGTELQLGVAHLDLTDAMPQMNRGSRTGRNQFWDLNLMYYPWGDARWRPFVSLGFGAGDFDFADETGQRIRETVWTFPVSAGLKYYQYNWLAWRVTVTDHWSPAAQGLDAMHNIAVTVGAELHFGGTRVGYFPYRAGKHLW